MSDTRETVMFLNPSTCGVYKDGGTRFKTNHETGRRTEEIDNELIAQVDAHLAGGVPPGASEVALEEVFRRRVLVPTYYDGRFGTAVMELLEAKALEGVTLGELLDRKVLAARAGHGSPPNDQREGDIPYVKVSDIRALRVNVNPTNLVSEAVARRFWKTDGSGLEAWDVVTPNRASSNIGEFAMLLPGEERIVVTKEVFVFRVVDRSIIDPFFLLWALCLRAVRDQWRRIALMQTNREDCGARHREILIPWPSSRAEARALSAPFRCYFVSLAEARRKLVECLQADEFEYTGNVAAASGGPG